MKCQLCDAPRPDDDWPALCGTGHGSCCTRWCPWCMAELRGWDE